MNFSQEDLRFIEETGRSVNDIVDQFQFFRTGFDYLKLDAPAKIGEGIVQFDKNEVVTLLKTYPKVLEQHQVAKFVPASGAASRMFKELFDYIECEGKCDSSKVETLMKNIHHYAFFHSLRKKLIENGYEIEKELIKQNYLLIAKYLLTDVGLNYGQLPKALLEFHRYDEDTHTAFEEHFVEAAKYAQNKKNDCYLHFTVSPSFISLFENKTQELIEKYQKKWGILFHVTFSIQEPSTDTLAAEMDNSPFYDDRGKLLFRPGGHGALLFNLNNLRYDIIFIKNIDNIVAQEKLEPTILYKKLLCSYLINIQTRIFYYLRKIEKKEITANLKEEIITFGKEKLNILHINDENMYDLLNRPLRVCGMVRNEGEPGGGPFWVNEGGGERSLQIVESAQVNMADENQKKIFDSSTHFNPVDIVCSFKDHHGKYFNLLDYRDLNSGFISTKSYGNRMLKAMELPGLWNGAMAKWITVFVEVPLETFNPVKTIFDLEQK